MFNTEKMQYKIVTLYSSVFSYLVCCFVHAENHCSADKVDKTSRIKRTWQQYFILLSEGSQGHSNRSKEWKYSTLILVPLPIPATKKEITRLHKASLGQGRRDPWPLARHELTFVRALLGTKSFFRVALWDLG